MSYRVTPKEQALYHAIAHGLNREAGVRLEGVFITRQLYARIQDGLCLPAVTFHRYRSAPLA